MSVLWAIVQGTVLAWLYQRAGESEVQCMGDPKTRIRTPVSVYLRRIRQRWIPVLVFFSTLSCAFWLWRRHAGLLNPVGMVETAEHDRTAPPYGVRAAPPHGRAGISIRGVPRNPLRTVAGADRGLPIQIRARRDEEIRPGGPIGVAVSAPSRPEPGGRTDGGFVGTRRGVGSGRLLRHPDGKPDL
jgi:hypothetical protein